MCYPQGLLLIASLMSLWDVLAIYWICIQHCCLRGVGISAQQMTAQFDMDFFPLTPSSQPLQLASPWRSNNAHPSSSSTTTPYHQEEP